MVRQAFFLYRVLRQQLGHALEADDHRRGVVQQRRGRRRQNAGHAQADQQEVKADDLAVVAVDALHERIDQKFERQQCVQIVGADVRWLHRH